MDVFALTMRLKEEGAGQVRAAVGKMRESFKAAAKDAKVLNKASSDLSNQFKNLAGSLAAVAGAGATMRAMDAFAQMTNQLKLATSSTEEFQAAQQAVIGIAQRTNQPLEAVAELYGKVSRSAASLGLSQDQVAKLTENVNKALLINKTDAGAAAGGMIQLAQALSNGVVRAEEFNSIMESMPPLIQAMEKEAGLVPGTLRKMAVEGRLSSEEFAKAMVSNRRITQQFADYVPTVSQQLVGLRNQFVLLAGKVGEVTGFTETLSKAIGWLKDNLPTVTALVGGLAAMWVTYKLAILGAAAATALVAGAETLASLFALAKAVRNVGDAMAFVTLASGGWVKLIAVIASVAIGMTAFRYVMDRMDTIMQSVTEKTEAQTESIIKLNGAYQQFGEKGLQSTNKLFQQGAEKGKSYLEMLVELAGLVPITTGQQAKLVAEEARLSTELAKTNINMATRLKLAQQLKGVQEALGTATVKYTLDEAAARFKAQAGTFGAGPLKRGFQVASIDPEQIKATAPGIKTTFDALRAQTDLEVNKAATEVRDSLYNVLGDALLTGVEAAFQKGANFGTAMKAFGAALLAGLGSVMVAFGQRLIQLGVALKTAMDSFRSGNGFAMIAAGLAIVAIGSALRGAAGRAMDQTGFGGGGGGAGGFSAPAMVSTGSMGLSTQFYGPTAAAGAANTIERVNPVNVTIIGPNDPAAQRQMQELLRNANRRGSA